MNRFPSGLLSVSSFHDPSGLWMIDCFSFSLSLSLSLVLVLLHLSDGTYNAAYSREWGKVMVNVMLV